MTRRQFARTMAPAVLALVLGAGAAAAQTGSPMDMLIVTPYMQEDMALLMERDKFGPDPEHGYAGLPNQGVARRLNQALNQSLGIMLSVAEESRSRAAVLERLRGFLEGSRTLGLPDAEVERALWCYRQALDILGIDVTDEMLRTWAFGTGTRR